MKKLTALLLSLALLQLPCAALTDINVPAQDSCHTADKAYNWYCRRTDDHSQPPLDPLFSFIEKEGLETYYIDKDSAEEKVIYLTFDAGYENGNVEKILDTLKEEKVTGAFFVLEHLIKTNTDLVRRMCEEGHLVCNHTATHPDMTKRQSEADFMAEICRLEEVAKEYSVTLSDYYRPPEGRFSEENLRIAAKNGYKTVFWSYAYADWDNNAQLSPAAALEKVLSGTHNGAVILLHPTSATNAAILVDLIRQWKADGYRFGTLDELTK